MAEMLLTTSRCTICQYPLVPYLVNITNMGDELPKWLLDWNCDNHTLHDYIQKYMQKEQTNG
jgi:hypothetical protein